jgi:Xaa-Pro aminopeptidase
MDSKVNRIITQLNKDSLDGLILSSPANISYLTELRSRDAYLVISQKENVYITDSRYIEEARKRLKGFTIEQTNSAVFKKIADICHGLRLKCVGFEERQLPFAAYKEIRKELNNNVGLVATSGLVEELRQLKTPQELEKIRKAIQISIKAFRFIKDFIVIGKKELEIAAELERFIRYNGATASSFDIIVAAGENSSFPHHLTSERKIKKDEVVLLDLGVDYLGYKSDLTRVFFSGKINPLVKKIYRIVLRAQELAMLKIKPGVVINKIDGFARGYIEKKGYASFFSHGLGHGVGLEVHEEPYINKKENKRLKNNMVFTVEPAIYLPDNFGIRIEDMVLVTKERMEVLSGALDK